jgi:hypothetical protein
MRDKPILKGEFDDVQRRNWDAVELIGDARPTFIAGMPEKVLYRFIASGQEVIQPNDIGTSIPVGGIDVYRYSPDDPVRFNKDRYEVLLQPSGGLIARGPFKDDEHWLNEVPRRYEEIEVLGATKKREQDP